MTDLREKLTAIIDSGKQAELALAKLGMLETAEGEDATIADLKAAVVVAEAEGDFQTSSILKDRWIGLLRRGAQ